METTPRHSISLNLDSSAVSTNPYLSVLSPFVLNMYTPQHLDAPYRTNMDNMYSKSPIMNEKEKISQMEIPKKENIFQSVFNTLTNMIGEHFARVPATFMSNMNAPLSVTVVPNEGIISHDFFKSLTSRREPKAGDMHAQNVQKNGVLNIVERMQSQFEDKFHIIDTFDKNPDTFNEHDLVDSTKDKTGDLQYEKWFSTTDDYIHPSGVGVAYDKEVEFGFHIPQDKIPQIDSLGTTQSKTQAIDKKGHTEKDLDSVNSQSLSTDKSNCTKTPITIGMSPANLTAETADANFKVQTAISNLFSGMWQKVVDGVTDLYQKTEADMDMLAKRSHSPKQRKKLVTVAKGRGRGRARSQLRRSGVSQTRHRKERTRHELASDMQNDFETWQDFEVYCQNKNLLDDYILDDNQSEVADVDELSTRNAAHSEYFLFGDIKPSKQKPRAQRSNQDQGTRQFSSRVWCVSDRKFDSIVSPDIDEESYDSKSRFRPRLMSESSVESEDSYCIVFDTGLESNYDIDAFKTDFDYIETSDEAESIEDKFEIPRQKVKFNLKPIVHTMVQWDYAYRAARRGPWEEMARDRERFRGRINCIERVLNPILTTQHRAHVWQERFACQ